MPLVRAKLMGFRDKVRIRPGTVFEFPEGKQLPKWVELVTDANKEAPKKPAPRMKTREERIEEDLAG